MSYFENIESIEQLKKEYRRLCFIHHPDKGGDAEIMKTINAEYSDLFDALKNRHNAEAKTTGGKEINEMPEEFIEILSKLVSLAGLDIELCGSWVWIGGETKPHKEILKEAGCRWAPKKKMWYWRSDADACRFSRGRFSMDEIREMYGSTKVVMSERKALA